MATLLSDDFNRADSTTSLGSPVTGGPYTVVSGTWGINSNQAYLSTPAAGALVTFPAAFNLDITYKLGTGFTSTVGAGFAFRYTDANNHWTVMRSSTGNMALFRVVAGTPTLVTGEGAAATGDIIRVIAYGDQIAWYVNGAWKGQVTDQWAAAAPTVAALRNYGTATGRWDDVLVVDRATAIVDWGSAAMELPPDTGMGATYALTPSLYKGRDTAAADESEIP